MNTPDASVSELLFDSFLSRRHVYCYGATHEATLFMTRYPGFFDGVIDRKHPAGTTWNGLACVDIGEIDADTVVVNCVTAANAWGVDQDLKGRSERVLHVFGLLELLSDNHQFDIEGLSPIIRDWSRFPSVFRDNIEFFASLGARFADDTSRTVYRDYLDARILGNILVMGRDKMFCDPATMYFQPFLPALDDYVFLDVGAFDGQNSLAYLERYPNGTAVCVEPDPANVEQIGHTLANHTERCKVLTTLLGDVSGEFDVEPGGSSTAKVATASASSIRVAQQRLDDVYADHGLAGRKVFLKIDVEGSEGDILKGASEFLRGPDNVLALSCYHKSDDLLTLWPLIEPFAKDRNVHLRHLTTGACETVLFVS